MCACTYAWVFNRESTASHTSLEILTPFFLFPSKVRLKCSALHFTLKGLYYIFYFLPFEGLSEALLSSGGVCWCFFVLCNPQWFIRVPARRSVCVFFSCNRHWFNRVPGSILGIAYPEYPGPLVCSSYTAVLAIP